MSVRQITIGSLAMSSVGMLRIMAQIFVIPILARYISPEE
jgi:O-antigen/teichoic acid export membrane protein